MENQTESESSTSHDLKANRPEPIVSNIEVFPYKRRTDPQEAIDALIDGYQVLVSIITVAGLNF